MGRFRIVFWCATNLTQFAPNMEPNARFEDLDHACFGKVENNLKMQLALKRPDHHFESKFGLIKVH